jgi:hypothetical protein
MSKGFHLVALRQSGKQSSGVKSSGDLGELEHSIIFLTNYLEPGNKTVTPGSSDISTETTLVSSIDMEKCLHSSDENKYFP